MTDDDTVTTAADLLVDYHGAEKAERVCQRALSHIRQHYGREIAEAREAEKEAANA